MKNVRIIARLDIKGPNLVKGVHLEGLRVLGKPEYFAQYYYEKGIDELLYMDIVASLYGRRSLLEIIKQTSANTFIPLTVGGGLRTLEDIKNVLRAGADKVAINTAAINNPGFIKAAAKTFGSSTIVVAIDAIQQSNGVYHAFTDNGREYTDKEVISWAKEAAELGAGEILLTSVDQEGTGHGYDIELTRRLSDVVTIPVIACGGAGHLAHIRDVILQGKADAVCISSILHYGYIERHSTLEEDYSDEGNIEFLRSGEQFKAFSHVSVDEIKSYLIKHNCSCRITEEEKAAHV